MSEMNLTLDLTQILNFHICVYTVIHAKDSVVHQTMLFQVMRKAKGENTTRQSSSAPYIKHINTVFPLLFVHVWDDDVKCKSFEKS